MELTALFQIILVLRYRIIGGLVKLYLSLLGCKVGSGLKCYSFPKFKDIPKGNIIIGNHVAMGAGVVFEIAKSGNLTIDDHVTLGDFNRFSTTDSIQIGAWTAIAEMVSIRGSFHQIAKGTEIVKQGTDAASIHIGSDVLIGAKSTVLGGAEIPDGVVIGAHSLVKKSDKLHRDGIFAGASLKHLRDRI